jgi:hypothetical protein
MAEEWDGSEGCGEHVADVGRGKGPGVISA